MTESRTVGRDGRPTLLLRLLLSLFTLISRLAKADQQLATLEDIA